MKNLNDLLIDYIEDPEIPERNFDLARWYDMNDQTASAVSYYLRTAERSDIKPLQYVSLILAAKCFEYQGMRNFTVKGLYQNAITICPERPEAYYFLSKFYEEFEKDKDGSWTDAYLTACIGVSNSKDKHYTELPVEVGYPGYNGLVYQKAVNGWSCGVCEDARKILKELVLDQNVSESLREKCYEELVKIDKSNSFVSYKKEDHSKLRYNFLGSEYIENNYSEAFQDIFVLMMLNGKKNGTYLEMGSGVPYYGNNTALLEELGWNGVGLDLHQPYVDQYNSERKNTSFLKDAITLNYKDFLSENGFKNQIDYLQLDCDPASNTFEVLKSIPFDEYKFSVITYEHDYYIDDSKSYKYESRKYLESKGYELVLSNVAVNGWKDYEDWWVHPDLVNRKIIDYIKDTSDKVKIPEEYLLTHKVKNISNTHSISTNVKKTCWVVDNFYENPDKVREFALNQYYIEGGFGRGFIGRRTENQFLFPGLKEKFEEIIGMKITEWESHGMNGRFQNCHSGEPLVYHCDSQKWGGMLYLTPGAPYQCGTTLYAHKQTRARSYHDSGWDAAWANVPGDPHLDGTPFEPVDVLGNVYNRLVIFDASCIHSASEYFGTVIQNSRLWQMFFFDT